MSNYTSQSESKTIKFTEEIWTDSKNFYKINNQHLGTQNWPKLDMVMQFFKVYGIGFYCSNDHKTISVKDFESLYSIRFNDTCFDYVGSNPIDDEDVPLVEYYQYPVLMFENRKMLDQAIFVYLRKIVLFNNTLTEKIVTMNHDYKGILPSGTVLVTPDNKTWTWLCGEPFSSPLANIWMEFSKILGLITPLKSKHNIIMNQLNIEKILEYLTSFKHSNGEYVWGIANDISGSKNSSKDEVSELGSKLIDKIAIYTQNKVLSGGDGTEGYIVLSAKEARSLFIESAIDDNNLVKDSEMGLRQCFFPLNPEPLFNLLGFEDRHKSQFLEFVGKVAAYYGSILQSTSKDLTCIRPSKAVAIVPEYALKILGLKPVECISSNGVIPLFKETPKHYIGDKDSSIYFRQHLISVAVFNSATIESYLK